MGKEITYQNYQNDILRKHKNINPFKRGGTLDRFDYFFVRIFLLSFQAIMAYFIKEYIVTTFRPPSIPIAIGTAIIIALPILYLYYLFFVNDFKRIRHIRGHNKDEFALFTLYLLICIFIPILMIINPFLFALPQKKPNATMPSASEEKAS